MDALELQDAAMQGVALYKEWERKFLLGFQESIIKGQVAQAWAMMPPALKEQLKQQDPDGYKRVVSMLGGA